MAPPLTVETLLGNGILRQHLTDFVREGFSLDVLKEHIPNEDLVELGLTTASIAVFRLRTWSLATLGEDRFQEKLNEKPSLDILEKTAMNTSNAIKLSKEELRAVFSTMATRRVFLNAGQAELAKQLATEASRECLIKLLVPHSEPVLVFWFGNPIALCSHQTAQSAFFATATRV